MKKMLLTLSLILSTNFSASASAYMCMESGMKAPVAAQYSVKDVDGVKVTSVKLHTMNMLGLITDTQEVEGSEPNVGVIEAKDADGEDFIVIRLVTAVEGAMPDFKVLVCSKSQL